MDVEALFMRVGQKLWAAVFLISFLFVLFFVSGCLAEGGQIHGVVWVEKTSDGVYGSGESGYENAKITLERLDESGVPQVAINTTSSRSGEFAFGNLPDGQYRIRVEVQSDYRFALHGLDSAALPAQGSVSYTPYFQVSGGDLLEKSIGLLKTYASVTLVAFEDTNENGGRMQAEPAVRGISAELLYDYDGVTYVVATAVTDRNGEALIRDLSPGSYRLRVYLPENNAPGPMGQKMNTFYNCFMSETEQTAVTPYFSIATKESIGLGIGLVRSGALTGKVWYDANFNGLWDADESGLPDAVVSLRSSGIGESRVTSPDDSGVYSFRSLQPGEYYLTFTLPQGMIFTYPGVSMISDTANESSMRITVQVDVTASMGAVGAMPAAGASIFLYQDENLNGAYDEGEAPLPDVSISASQNGAVVETAVSDASGMAVLNGLRGGETVLTAELPYGYIFFASGDGLFQTPDAQDFAQVTVELDGTQPEARFSSGVTIPSSIDGIFFEDASSVGVYQEGDALLSGFTVQAVNENGIVARETVTDAGGAYSLSPLSPGSYTVRFVLDDVYVASPVSDDTDPLGSRIHVQTPEYGETNRLSLTPGMRVSNINGGAFRAGTVDGQVLIDPSYETNLVGLSGVQVLLLNENGVPYSSYTYGFTDENGDFLIKGVLPGIYSLAYVLPDRGVFTDPAVTEKKWISESFSTESGSQIHMPTLYGVYTSTLSGTILHDNAGDESSFSALLTLIAHSANQVFQVHCQPDGQYAFTGLAPDTYTLQVVLPDQLVFGQMEGAPISGVGANKASAEISFEMGDAWEHADMLASLPVVLTGTVYNDDNLTGEMEEDEYGAEGRVLSAYLNGQEIARTETDAQGAFTLDHLIPGAYELRMDMDEDERLVKVSDAEPGEGYWAVPVSMLEDASVALPLMRYASVSGAVWSLDGTVSGVQEIPVTLQKEDGQEIETVLTDDQGCFAFHGLLPGGYSLSAVLPEGYLFARAQDTENRSSYIQGLPDGTPSAVSFYVVMGDDMSGMDIGMGAMGKIGDRAWLDENGNGLQDIGEPGLPGVEIQLYQHGELIVSATTDIYGRYTLTDIYPGEYEMRCVIPAEVKATVHNSSFPLVNSVLTETDGDTPSGTVIVPSGGENLHCDVGFQLRKKGVYPAVMDTIPVKDWRPYSER